MTVHSMNRTQPRCKNQNYTVEVHNNSFNSPHKTINKSIVVILLSLVATQSKKQTLKSNSVQLKCAKLISNFHFKNSCDIKCLSKSLLFIFWISVKRQPTVLNFGMQQASWGKLLQMFLPRSKHVTTTPYLVKYASHSSSLRHSHASKLMSPCEWQIIFWFQCRLCLCETWYTSRHAVTNCYYRQQSKASPMKYRPTSVNRPMQLNSIQHIYRGKKL